MIRDDIAREQAQPPPPAGQVLVVDDEAPLADQLVDAIRALGHPAGAVHSAQAAMAALAANPGIAVVVSDVRMPVEDGLEFAARAFRSRAEEEAVEFIMITGHLSLDSATDALRVGAVDLLQKPFRLKQLSGALSVAMERAMARREAARQRTALAERLARSETERLELARRLTTALERLGEGRPAGSAALGSAEIAAISHALRTPLNALSGGLDLMETTPAAGKDREVVGLLRGGLSQAVDAVERLEELQNAHPPPPGATREPCDLTALALREMARLAEAGVEVQAAPAPPLERVARAARAARAFRLAIETLVQWGGGRGRIGLTVEPAMAPGGWDCLTFRLDLGPAPLSLPHGPEFPAYGTPLSRTVECIRFLTAQRLVLAEEARVTSWVAGRDGAAIRFAFPPGAPAR